MSKRRKAFPRRPHDSRIYTQLARDLGHIGIGGMSF